MTRPIRQRALWLLLAGFAGSAVLIGTLWPLSELPSGRNTPLSVQWRLYPPDILRNLILFGVPAAFTRRWKTQHVLLTAALVSISIESLQNLIPGRVPSILDVLANVLGAWIGHHVTVWYVNAPAERWRKHRALYLGWVAITTLALVIAPVAFTPHLPVTPWYVHAPPQLGHLEPYSGKLLEAKLNGQPVQNGPLPVGVLASDFSIAHRLEIRGEAGPLPSQLSGLFYITDDSGREVALLGLQGTNLFYRLRSLGDHWGLESPRLWWRGAFPAELDRGAAFVVRVEQSNTETCLEVNSQRQCRRAVPFQESWQLWLPSRALGVDVDHELGRWWLMALFLPLGAGYRPRTFESCLLLWPISALMIAPWLGPISYPTPENIAFMALAFTLGQGGAAWMRSHNKASQLFG